MLLAHAPNSFFSICFSLIRTTFKMLCFKGKAPQMVKQLMNTLGKKPTTLWLSSGTPSRVPTTGNLRLELVKRASVGIVRWEETLGIVDMRIDEDTATMDLFYLPSTSKEKLALQMTAKMVGVLKERKVHYVEGDTNALLALLANMLID
jgi:hypothetical protein